MKTRHTILLIMILTALLVYPVGCMPDDPLPDTLYTKDILPGATDSYTVGSEDFPYAEGYFIDIFATGTTTTRRILYSGDYWDDLRTPATAVKLSGVKPPLLTEYKGGAVLEFENQGAPNEQQIFFTLQVPHSWKEGTNILPHIHWAPKANTAGANLTVIWQLTYSWANQGAVLPGTTTITATETINNQIDEHLLSSFAPIEGNGKLISSMLICSVTRLSGTDTFTDSAYFLEVDFHVEVDTPGSKQELVK